MKRKIKFFITFLFTMLLCFIVSFYQKNFASATNTDSPEEPTEKASTESATPSEQPAVAKPKVIRQTLYQPPRDENGDEISDVLTFIFTSDKETLTANNDDDGEVGVKVLRGVVYTVTLKDNPKYTMDSFNLIVKDDGFVYNADTGDVFFNYDLKTKKPSSEETTKPKEETSKPNESSEETTPKKETSLDLAVFDQDENEVSDKLDFEFTSKEGTFTASSKDSKITANFKENTSYSIKLLNNPTYTMNNLSFIIKDGVPYREDNNDLLIALDVVKHVVPVPKPEVEEPKVEKPGANTEVTPPKPNKKDIFTLYLSVYEGDEESEADLTFEFTSNGVTTTSKNDAGQIGTKIVNGQTYTVKLVDNKDYTFEPLTFIAKGGRPYEVGKEDLDGLIVKLDVVKKGSENKPTPDKPAVTPEKPKPTDPDDCGCDDPNQEKVTIKQLKIVDIKNPNGETIKDPLTFVFFNVSKQKPAGEYTSVNGKLPRIEMLVDDEYEVYLKDNDKYGMRHRHFYAFMNHYPIDMDDEYERYTDILEVIKKDKDYVEPKQPAVRAIMQVRYNGKLIKEPVTFEFISNGETLQATSVDGVVTVNLRESVDYMVGVINNDKYSIETFPIVIKNKQFGKFPYDHRTCWLVEYLDLVDKGSVSVENPHYTIATKDEKVRISGMDFKDLKLEVNTIEPKTIPALAGKDTLVYDINFINIYRKEVVKLKGDFTVTVPKERGRKVKAIYYINDFGQLEKREAIPGEFNSVITFKTDRFSRFALVYEDKVVTHKGDMDGKPAVEDELPDFTGPVPVATHNGDMNGNANSEPALPAFTDDVPVATHNGDMNGMANSEPALPAFTGDVPVATHNGDMNGMANSEPALPAFTDDVPVATHNGDENGQPATEPALSEFTGEVSNKPTVTILNNSNKTINVTLNTTEKDLNLVTKEITDKAELDLVKEKVVSVDKNFSSKDEIASLRLLDLTLTKDDKEYNVDAPRTVRIALLEQEKGKEIFIYHVGEDGTLTPITKENNNLKVKNGVVEFTINHFSKFAIVAKVKDSTPRVNNSTTPTTKNNTTMKEDKKSSKLPNTTATTANNTLLGLLVLLSALGIRKIRR